MYKPANIREFVTPAVLKHVSYTMIEGRSQKTFTEAENPNIRGKFKQKGSTELNANGLTIVNDHTSFITWWRSDFRASDILTINGIDYQIIGTPEDVEMRHRYAVLNLVRYEGGA